MMTDEPVQPRNWKRWAVIAVLMVALLVLYPQLMDFGSELYRLFG